MKRLCIGILSLLLVSQVLAQSDTIWWLNGATEKILASATPTTAPLHISAGRLEYAPFQLAISATSVDRAFDTPLVVYPQDYFTLTWYQETFIPILRKPTDAEIFTLARITDQAQIPDGLHPLEDSFDVRAGDMGILWADVYVNAGTPAGDYTLDIMLDDITQSVTLTVYAIDIPPTNGMSIILPTNKADNISFYADSDEELFLRQVNQLLLDNNLIPGTLAGNPVLNGNQWDFSAFDSELDKLPEGSKFYPPMPFDTVAQQYWFPDQTGTPYVKTDFEDVFFVSQLDNYFAQLSAYLNSKGRLDGALAYPTDRSVWVADEPDHNGAAGYIHLSEWKKIINRNGMRVTASRVSPAPYAPGWLPSDQVTDDTHVHLDLFDAGLQPYTDWMATPGHSSSVYLNHYGDFIELPAAINRDVIWHVYGRGLNMIAGYETMDWFDEKFNLLDPFTQADQLFPKFGGYGIGALVYPGPLPSIRIKVLREGVEDARLLDLYGFTFGSDQARAFALCLSPLPMTDENPPATLWDDAHTALLQALTNNQPVDNSLCQPMPTYSDQTIVADMEDNAMGGDWSIENADFSAVTSPWDNSLAYQITYTNPKSSASFDVGGNDWSAFNTVLIDIQNPTPYYVEFDFSVGDNSGHYLQLRPGVNNIAPNSMITLALPLVVPFNQDMVFDWTSVSYLELYANTTIERTDGFEDEQVYDIGPRTLIFDNIRLAKKQ